MKKKGTSLLYLAYRLSKLINRKGKNTIFFSLFIASIGGITEIVSLQLFGWLLNPKSRSIEMISYLIPDKEGINITFLLAIYFLVAIALNVTFKIIAIRASTYTSAYITTKISHNVIKELLYSPFNSKNKPTTSESTALLSVHTQQLSQVIHYFLNATYSILLLIGLLIGMLMVIGPSIFISFGLIIFAYILVTYYFKPKIIRNNFISKTSSDHRMLLLNETLGSIREIILYSLRDKFASKYESTNKKILTANTNCLFYNASPRYLIESIIMSGFAIYIAYLTVTSTEDITLILSSLAVFSYGSIRLLTNSQNVYNSISSIRARSSEVESIINILAKTNYRERSNGNGNKNYYKKNSEFKFQRAIELRKLSFEYHKDNRILSDINLSFKKGEKVFIYGESGSGKSTLIDIIMGFLIATSGKILIDDIDINSQNYYNKWFQNIAHVPQKPFALTDSIYENLALGSKDNKLNIKKAISCLTISDLSPESFGLKTYSELLKFKVEEAGTNLSGGQLQRLAIARAIFSGRNVLVMDEPTSALDNNTAMNVINRISKMEDKKTMFVVSHNKKIQDCFDRFIHIEKNRVEELKYD